MGFLDEYVSFSDSSEDEDDDKQMSQDRLVRSIQDRLRASDLSDSDEALTFDVTDDTEEAVAIHQFNNSFQADHQHRMTDNLDHVDLTALRASQVQEVLSRAANKESQSPYS